MLQSDSKGNSLHDHLLSDHFFDNNHHLNIIDDYHIKNIKEDAVAFYQEAFNGTGLRTLTFYFQIKNIYPNTLDQIKSLSRFLKINNRTLTAFLVLFLTNINGSKNSPPLSNKLYREIDRGKFEVLMNSIKDFNEAMKKIEILVSFQPYSSLNIKPPFHGRYWLTEHQGYIVDGSLQTYSNGKIFAQKMDNENFDLIYSLFKTEVQPKARDYIALDVATIENIYRTLTSTPF